MIWVELVALVVVFVVGFQVLTSDSRHTTHHLNECLGTTSAPLESMTDQLGKTTDNRYLRYLERPSEAYL